MEIVGLVGFAGVVAFALLYVIFFFKGASLKIPVIGMILFAVVVAASAILPKLGIQLGAPKEPDAEANATPSQPAETEHPAESPEANQTEPPRSGDFSPQVLLDKRGIVITATGLNMDGAYGPELNVVIENNSETNVIVQTQYASVNDYMIETLFNASVSAGTKADSSVVLLSSDIQKSGIQTIADIELLFHISDHNLVTFLDSDPVTVRTSAADTYSYSFDDSGEELYNENGLRVVSKGISEDDSVFGPGLVVFVENTTGQNITLQAKNVLVNGRAVDTIFSEDIRAGKRLVAAITFLSTSLEDNGITQIKNVGFYFHVLETDGLAPIFDTDPITVSAE